MEVPMRVLGPLLALLLAAPAAALAAPAAEEDVVEPPAFTVGDWWLYRLKGDMRGFANSTVLRRENLTQNGSTHDSWLISGDVDASVVTQGLVFESDFTERKWVRAADHAKARTEQVETRSDEAMEAERTKVYEPPLREIVYPFGRGSAWTSESRVTTTEVSTIGGVPRPDLSGTRHDTEHVEGVVLGKIEIIVPAGLFLTYLIEYDGVSGFFRWYYAPEACTNVQEEYFAEDTDYDPGTTYQLLDYDCTKPAPPLEPVPEETIETAPPPPALRGGENNTTEDPAKEPERQNGRKQPGFEAAFLLAAVAGLVFFARRRYR